MHVYSCVQNYSSVFKKREKLKILIITFTSIHTILQFANIANSILNKTFKICYYFTEIEEK